jgi:peroxiredoxin
MAALIMGLALQSAPPAPTVGQVHADFALPSIDEGVVRLSDYRGKRVLLLHFASW